MEIRYLVYFAKFAELEGRTKSADALSLPQSVLGMQIKKPKQNLGVRFIERHSRGVRLTQTGRVLQDHANGIVNRIASAKSPVRGFGVK